MLKNGNGPTKVQKTKSTLCTGPHEYHCIHCDHRLGDPEYTPTQQDRRGWVLEWLKEKRPDLVDETLEEWAAADRGS